MVKEQAHTVRSYEQELDQVRGMLVRMGGIVESQMAMAMAAIVDRDEDAAVEASERDPQVDELEREIETLSIRLLALRAPMAGDLREIVAAMKISG
ncbi:MAG: PhoU domain-containing protein, partial [Gluconacetobacter sp.]